MLRVCELQFIKKRPEGVHFDGDAFCRAFYPAETYFRSHRRIHDVRKDSYRRVDAWMAARRKNGLRLHASSMQVLVASYA